MKKLAENSLVIFILLILFISALFFSCKPSAEEKISNSKGSAIGTANNTTNNTHKTHKQIGVASWYGARWQGRKTASGDRFNMHNYTAAHKTLPMGTVARVTNLENGKHTVVTINDRGPFKKGRIIDLSHAAARSIGMTKDGTARVKVEVIKTPKRKNEQEADNNS